VFESFLLSSKTWPTEKKSSSSFPCPKAKFSLCIFSFLESTSLSLCPLSLSCCWFRSSSKISLSFASYHRVLFHHVILTNLCSEVNIYLFLYPKEAFHILKKKKKASAKKEPHKTKKNQKCGCPILPRLRTYPFLPGLKTGPILLVHSCRSDLSNFTKAENLSVFTRAENWSDLACPFVPLGLVQFYQG
jgi:hypothetical protein